MTRWIAMLAAGAMLAACSGEDGAPGPAGTDGVDGSDGAQGPAGPGSVAIGPGEMAGFVRDTAGDAVEGATVYLVPADAIPSAALDLSSIAAARASTVDEPLEDTIAAQGASMQKAVTDAAGIYRIPAVAAGRYFVTVLPAAGDDAHLPGGNLCRTAVDASALTSGQTDLKVSTKPSSKAQYVGPSVCLNCHGVVHEMATLHMNGIRPIGTTGPLQDDSRFPGWNDTLARFEANGGAGTTLYYYGFANGDWKVSETAGANVSFTARMFKDVDGKLKVTLTNVKGTAAAQAPRTYAVELSYGGGLYKQRFVAKLPDGSRYILPIQFNYHAAAGEAGTEATASSTRWTWQQYNGAHWYTENTTDPTLSALREPAPERSFDNMCAGCHFTGFKLNGNKASAVADLRGEYDYDGDGKPEVLNVSCETCHGPGSEHWYRAGVGNSIVSPSLLTPEREVNICSECHTRFVGNGGVRNGTSALVTEAPLNAQGLMPVAGTSRAQFLAEYISKIDDGIWSVAAGGDGVHSQKHHQQASDFLKTRKYRNASNLMTCTSCHDVHGNSGLTHQLETPLDGVTAGAGLCLTCHDTVAPGTPMAAGIQAHWASKGVLDIEMGDISCVDCHMPKTAKSGSGKQGMTINGTTYWMGDISSHFFDVPRRADIANKSATMMPLPYTDKCGGCHILRAP